MTQSIVAVHLDSQHRFSKQSSPVIELIAGHGVRGDSHSGRTVQHRSRVARDPSLPNLRQVHLLHQELLDELAESGFDVAPGSLGENVTTRGLAILEMSANTILQLGAEARVRVTGLRNPCAQIEAFRPGLLARVVAKAANGELIRKAGVMCVVEQGGLVRPGDAITIVHRPQESLKLVPV